MGLCKRRQLVVLSERESRQGPDTVDKHLSLHLPKQACVWPVCAADPMNGLCSAMALSSVTVAHPLMGNVNATPPPTTYTQPESRAAITHAQPHISYYFIAFITTHVSGCWRNEK